MYKTPIRKYIHRILFLAALIVMLCSALLSSSVAQQQKVFWVPLKDVPDVGAVEWGLASFVHRALQEAEREGAQAIVFEIDTFGGRVDAMLFMQDLILKSPLRSVAFVNSKAWSAGVFLALSCETIAMAPDGTVGAAEPRGGGQEDAVSPDPKIVSAIRAQIEALAEARGRDPLLFAAMVDRTIVIEDLVGEGELLTLTASRALERGAADFIARNRQEVLEQAGLEDMMVVDMEPSWSESLARFLTHPTVIPLLLLIAFGGIFMEIMTPGFGLPGAAGLIAMVLFFGGRYMAGLAGLEPLLLFLVGVILLALEILVIPGFGVAGVSGIGALVASLYLVLRETTILLPEVAVTQLLFYIGMMGVVLLVLLVWLPENPIWKRLGLFKKEEDKVVPEETLMNYPSLVGKNGVARSVLRPAGIAEIEGKRYDVVTRGEFIEQDEAILVEEVQGNRIIVRRQKGGG